MWVKSLGQEDSPGEGNGNPLQYSFLDNPMDKGAWQTTVHWVAESEMTEWLNNRQAEGSRWVMTLITSLRLLFCLWSSDTSLTYMQTHQVQVRLHTYPLWLLHLPQGLGKNLIWGLVTVAHTPHFTFEIAYFFSISLNVIHLSCNWML